jgi:hypothetical protein
MTSIPANPVTETFFQRWGRRFSAIVHTAIEIVLHILSLTAPIIVAVWAYGLCAEKPLFPIPAPAIVLLMLIEIWKTTSASQVGRQAFLVDLITGQIQLVTCAVALALFLQKKGFDPNVALEVAQAHWAMLLFVLCDATFSIYNRHSLVYRQSTFMTQPQTSHHHSVLDAATGGS